MGVRPVPERNDSGMTLIELLVAMTVLAVVAAISTRATIMIARSVTTATQSADAVGEVRLALGSIERQVRSGNVMFSPAGEPTSQGCQVYGTNGGSCMRVYTQVAGVRRCVQWQVLAASGATGRAFMRTRSFSPAWDTDGDVGSWRTVARGLQLPSASSPPFVLQGGSTMYSSRLLDVAFVVPDPRGGGRTVTLASSLSGRNTTYGFDNSLCSPGPA